MALHIEKPIVLVGLMGAGKTSIGQRVAERLEIPFHDMDREIEAQEKLTVSQIFELKGEPYFRAKEREVITALLDQPPSVIATGGGAFVQPEIRALVKQKATSVWLRATVDQLLERTSRTDTRPLLRTDNPRAVMEKLVDERYPIYAEADLVVDTDEQAHYKVVDTIIWKI